VVVVVVVVARLLNGDSGVISLDLVAASAEWRAKKKNL
jgi:hypothetical protein